MSEFRRKPKKRINLRPLKKDHKSSAYDNIDMSSKASRPKQYPKRPSTAKLKVINGKKRRRLINRVCILALCFVLVLIFVLLSALSPTGIGEYMNNTFAKMSKGSLPVDITGGKLVDFKSNYGILTLLTDTNIELYNSSGKCMGSYNHGMSKPAVRTSQARSILYGISDTSYKILNYSDVIYSANMSYEILSADISRCGTYAIATRSDSYASQVEVFSKKNESLFTWSSAKELINCVAVSANGKKIAVSTLSAENGVLKCKVYIFDYKHSTPRFTFAYDAAVLSLHTVSGLGFAVTTASGVDFVSWKGAQTKNSTELPINIIKTEYNDYSAVCTRREGDKSQSNIIVFNKSGKQTANVSVLGNLQDFVIYNNHIYCLVQTEILVYNFEGVLTKNVNCGFGISGIHAASAQKIVLISENNLKLCSIK